MLLLERCAEGGTGRERPREREHRTRSAHAVHKRRTRSTHVTHGAHTAHTRHTTRCTRIAQAADTQCTRSTRGTCAHAAHTQHTRTPCPPLSPVLPASRQPALPSTRHHRVTARSWERQRPEARAEVLERPEGAGDLGVSPGSAPSSSSGTRALGSAVALPQVTRAVAQGSCGAAEGHWGARRLQGAGAGVSSLHPQRRPRGGRWGRTPSQPFDIGEPSPAQREQVLPPRLLRVSQQQ